MMATESSLMETLFSEYQKGFVVFEGTDQSGKTSQLDLLREIFPDIYIGHQPSSPLEQMGFECRDVGDWKSLKGQWSSLCPLGRWMLHAASHAQHYVELEPLFLEQRPVLLDRFWWSAYAYNFCADNLPKFGISKKQFLATELAATRDYTPQLVIFFSGTVTKVQNRSYNAKLEAAYRDLIDITQDAFPDRLRIIEVWPARHPENIHAEVMYHLNTIGFGR